MGLMNAEWLWTREHTNINGPHQGAWVTTQTGEDWFLHFQDKGVYGRVVHLEPMKWINDWPVIGIDKNGNGKGEPVLTYKKPNVGKTYPVTTPAESDEFNSNSLGLQWQWMANPQPTWYFTDPAKGVLRLYSARVPDSMQQFVGCSKCSFAKISCRRIYGNCKNDFSSQ